MFEIDDMTVYCSEVVASKNKEITIRLGSYFGIKHLSLGRIKI